MKNHIDQLYNFLNDKDLENLKNYTENFSPNSFPGKYKQAQNYYNRMYISDYSHIQNYVSNLEKYSAFDFFDDKEIWINQITEKSNSNDPFHRGITSLIFFTFLNDNFTGGEFEYRYSAEGPIQKILPRKNLTIIIDQTIPHRILPISSGELYFLKCFYFNKQKEENTII